MIYILNMGIYALGIKVFKLFNIIHCHQWALCVRDQPSPLPQHTQTLKKDEMCMFGVFKNYSFRSIVKGVLSQSCSNLKVSYFSLL
jgi:hypothetical protein